jgi:hypothetical protein
LQDGDAAAAAEEPVVTGQGWWTGMSYAFQVDGTKTPLGMIEKQNDNFWGTNNAADDVRYWTDFNYADSYTTDSDSDWQVNTDNTKFVPAASATEQHHFLFTAWRLGSAGDSQDFKIIPNVTYYGQSGYRRWPQGTTSGAAVASANTPYTSFMFEGANMTVLGFGAIATAVLTMF